MRILLADDDPQVRSALRLLLEQEPEVDVIGEAVDATTLIESLRSIAPGLLILDLELPGLAADGFMPSLRSLHPKMRVVALSGRPEARQRALAAGVDSFVSKGDPPECLLAALRSDFGGER